MKLREVDPLEPQPGDRVRIYTPIYTDPDHPTNWDEGVVSKNTETKLVLESGYLFQHAADEDFGLIYYIVEEA